MGSVGATGLATGPHWHYKFLLSGVHRNPATIVKKLPQAKSVDSDLLPDFTEQIQPLIAQLNRYHQSTRIALAEPETTVN